MTMFKDQSVQVFLDQLASATPTPGGGSAAAVMGAMGAALVSMVANLTVGKPSYQAVQEEMKILLNRSETLRSRLISSIQADVAAFNEVMAAYRLPKQDNERHNTIQASLKTATDVPLDCARLCSEVIELCQEVAEKGNANVISDAGVGVLAAHAALKSCSINVLVNLNAIEDPSFVDTRRLELDRILDGKDSQVETIYTRILKKL